MFVVARHRLLTGWLVGGGWRVGWGVELSSSAKHLVGGICLNETFCILCHCESWVHFGDKFKNTIRTARPVKPSKEASDLRG